MMGGDYGEVIGGARKWGRGRSPIKKIVERLE